MQNAKDLRIIKTHMALCGAFLELMNAKSFDNITVSELCEKSMVRRATFYKHFNDKYDFFRFFITEMHKQLEEENPEELKNVSPYDYLIIMTERFIYFLDDNEKMIKHILESNLMPTLLDILGEEFMKNFKRIHAPHKDIPEEMIAVMAAFYTGGIMQTIRWWLSNKNSISKEQLIAICKNRLETIKQTSFLL